MKNKKMVLWVALIVMATLPVYAQKESDFKIVQLPNNTLKITEYTGNVENVVIPSTLYGLKVTIIGEDAFANSGIKSVVIPDTVTEIQGGAFRQDQSEKSRASLSKVTIGKGVKIIGGRAFAYQEKLTEITIPDSVTEIGSSAFYECGLTSITFGRGLQKIENWAFSKNNLTSVTLPASIKKIGYLAFELNEIHTVVIPHINIDLTTPTNSGVFYREGITCATLPANISDRDMYGGWCFEESLCNFYANQGRAAGTYVKNGPIWTRQSGNTGNAPQQQPQARQQPAQPAPQSQQQQNANNALAYSARGVDYYMKGDYDRAITEFTQAIKLDPNSAIYYSNRGDAYGIKGDYDKAIADCNTAIRLDPNLAIAYNNRAFAYRCKGDYDKAIADSNTAIRLDPNSALYYGNRAFAYGLKGDYDKAIADCNTAIRLEPNSALYYFARGDIYISKGDYRQARTDINSALKIDRNFQAAKDLDAELKKKGY